MESVSMWSRWLDIELERVSLSGQAGTTGNQYGNGNGPGQPQGRRQAHLWGHWLRSGPRQKDQGKGNAYVIFVLVFISLLQHI